MGKASRVLAANWRTLVPMLNPEVWTVRMGLPILPVALDGCVDEGGIRSMDLRRLLELLALSLPFSAGPQTLFLPTERSEPLDPASRLGWPDSAAEVEKTEKRLLRSRGALLAGFLSSN